MEEAYKKTKAEGADVKDVLCEGSNVEVFNLQICVQTCYGGQGFSLISGVRPLFRNHSGTTVIF